MEDFKRILYPVALTEISPKVAPYVVTLARQLDAQVHLLHVLRRFDWFVDTYVSDPPSLTSSALPATSKVRSCPRRNKNSKRFRRKYLSDIQIANTTWFPEPITSKF
jgi:nucleotide-binding universal stress UspA family protein